ncbi:YigZ family protein [Motilimonas pumila]|uniref:YigZ family protein n=1 Tax=Motilimonas pumila TaxID=2303987 RepID=A0A418YE33_9GAMM|nr:YigZ family protein [Motilimonas pumila]RJG42810.1 YigZ family protein [Motilimonas pumila]
MQPYDVLAAPVEFQEEIKKSRFITQLQRTQGRESAQAFVNEVKASHPTARHHCWAFVAAEPINSVALGFSDDGEPSGTAGKPILAALQGSGMGEITAVVTRYSGGIKLGTGGLVRAYGGGVQQALKLATKVLKTPQALATLACNYQDISLVESLLGQVDGSIVSSDYGVNVTLTLSFDARQAVDFKARLFDRSNGVLDLTLLP